MSVGEGPTAGGKIMNVLATEKLADVIARQSVVTAPMREMLEQYGPDAVVETETRVTAFGSYLMVILPVQP